jgi:hypothetical protein
MRKGIIMLAVCLGLAAGAAQAVPPPADKASVCVADAFDFPVGKPDALHYYKARGFQPNGHLGEDWNGGPGDSDLGLPVYTIGNGIIVFARDVRKGWGNVVIIRHCYFEQGELHCVDSLYGHLNQIQVQEGQLVRLGQQVGTIGNNHGMYDAHLHFEIRSNLHIGMVRAQFARDFSNYLDPTNFIQKHRALPGGPPGALIAINTFLEPGSSYQEPGAESSTARHVPEHGSHAFKIERFGDLENKWQM